MLFELSNDKFNVTAQHNIYNRASLHLEKISQETDDILLLAIITSRLVNVNNRFVSFGAERTIYQ